jgi:hypothetical protein
MKWLLLYYYSFFPKFEAVKLATNYEKISRQGTATILLSKHISCITIDKPLIGMELYFLIKNKPV